MSKTIDNYVAARREFEETGQALKKITDIVATVASNLQSDPSHFVFSNIDFGIPLERAMASTTRSVSADDWPTAKDIQLALNQLHEAEVKMRTAWANVPNEDRSALKPPPPRGMR